MEQEKKDRRIRKTRQILRDTLLTLLKEKRFDDISVQDIIERADMARSTFYVHYMDKDDLLTGRHGIFAENLSQQLTTHAGDASAFSSRVWFYHIQAHEKQGHSQIPDRPFSRRLYNLKVHRKRYSSLPSQVCRRQDMP